MQNVRYLLPTLISKAMAQSKLILNAGREFNDILNWLQTISTASKHNASIAIRKPDTAEWIFTNDEYLSWLSEDQSSNRLLWLHGPCKLYTSVITVTMTKILLIGCRFTRWLWEVGPFVRNPFYAELLHAYSEGPRSSFQGVT
jgi:hypothetical protein